MEETYYIHGTELRVSYSLWQEAPVQALVLSANNYLTLRGASGLAGWLNEKYPELHNECKLHVKKQEITPGDSASFFL